MGLNKKQKIIVAIFLFLIVVIFFGVYIKPYYAFEQKITYILDEKNKKFSSADVLSDYEMEQLQKISLYKCIAKNKQLFFTREQIQEILLIITERNFSEIDEVFEEYLNYSNIYDIHREKINIVCKDYSFLENDEILVRCKHCGKYTRYYISSKECEVILSLDEVQALDEIPAGYEFIPDEVQYSTISLKCKHCEKNREYYITEGCEIDDI